MQCKYLKELPNEKQEFFNFAVFLEEFYHGHPYLMNLFLYQILAQIPFPCLLVSQQLSDAISVIGREDFPERWPNLLEVR